MRQGIAWIAALGVASAMSIGATSAQTMVLSMKGPGAANPFWAAVERGAAEKAAVLGVELVVLSPPTETDVPAQIAQLKDQLAKGVNGIVLAPTDPNALAPVVEEAIADGVAVVFVDTNSANELGAALAAIHICGNIAEGSDVAKLQGIITQSTGMARADGSNAGLSACGLSIVAEQTVEWDRAKGLAVMENILNGWVRKLAPVLPSAAKIRARVRKRPCAGRLPSIATVAGPAQ